MTAAEKIKLLAELVQWDGARCFEPLTNLAHAGEVLEAMRAKGWHAVMLCPASGRHYCDFYQGPMTNRDSAPDGHESLAAAICHAALVADGVKEEEL